MREGKNEPEEEMHSIRDLENEIYSGKNARFDDERSRLHGHKTSVPGSWKEKAAVMLPQKIMSAAWYKKFFLGGIVFLSIAILFAVFTFLSGGNTVSSRYISLQLNGKTFADGGEEITMQIQIENRNREPLENAVLIIEYPEGQAGNPNATARIDRDLGTMDSGEQRIEDVTFRLYGEEGAEKEIEARLEYTVPDSVSVFSKTASHIIVLRSSPLRLLVQAPDSTAPNQEVTYSVQVSSNATDVLRSIMLAVEYPPGFELVRSTPQVSVGRNFWVIGDLPPGGSRTIQITGKISGVENESKPVIFSVGEQSSTNEQRLDTVYQTFSHTIALERAFLTADIVVNGSSQEEVVVQPGRPLSVQVSWQNTLPTTLTQARVVVSLSGSAYDKRGVSTQNGFFDSSQGTITWSPQQVPSLGSVDSGESGTFGFSLTPTSLASPQNVIYDPVIAIDVSVYAIQEGGAELRAQSLDRATIRLTSELRFSSKTLHYSGPFGNTGPMPPQSEQETSYTLVWQLANSSNKLTNTKLKTTLPQNVTWTGKTTSPSVTYNAVNREVTWDAGTIERGVGFQTTPPAEVAFQVSIKPSAPQVGSPVDLTGSIGVSAIDSNTGQEITQTRQRHSTRLLGDTSTVGGNGVVVP